MKFCELKNKQVKVISLGIEYIGIIQDVNEVKKTIWLLTEEDTYNFKMLDVQKLQFINKELKRNIIKTNNEDKYLLVKVEDLHENLSCSNKYKKTASHSKVLEVLQHNDYKKEDRIKILRENNLKICDLIGVNCQDYRIENNKLFITCVKYISKQTFNKMVNN